MNIEHLIEMCFLAMKLLQVIALEDQPVRWTTPLGLPVVQPYYKSERHLVSFTSCVGGLVYI